MAVPDFSQLMLVFKILNFPTVVYLVITIVAVIVVITSSFVAFIVGKASIDTRDLTYGPLARNCFWAATNP